MMKAKKIRNKFSLIVLTGGVSLLLGFLSFGGMLALAPILPLAIAAFFLSGAYEAEIYKRNIENALKKLFESNYLHQETANRCLLELLPENIKKDDCPQFFKDYKKAIKRLHKYDHKNLNHEDKQKKKKIKKRLKEMEAWFAEQLFSDENEEDSEYAKELKTWLKKPAQIEQYEKYRKLLASRSTLFTGVKIFSVVAASFMALGTTYLLVESFTAIPFLTAIIPFSVFPAFAIPMALIAGIAYGLLTYNAITDMINNETIQKLFAKVKNIFQGQISVKKVFSVIFSSLSILLIAALTICSAGTWWTIAKTAQPLFGWMSKMPSFIMGIINPIITGLSQLAFNIENAAPNIDLLTQENKEDGKKKDGFFTLFLEGIMKAWDKLIAEENVFQIFNPFRLLIKVTLFPLRVILFLGHVISMGATEDRVPGVPEIASAAVNVLAEIGVDGGYFFGLEEHDHSLKGLMQERFGIGHNHDHGNDIPSRILKCLFYPLYALAASWDYAASQLNAPKDELVMLETTRDKKAKPILESFRAAWDKQLGQTKKEVNVKGPTPLSKQAVKEQVIFSIDKCLKKHSNKGKVAFAREPLEALRQAVKTSVNPAKELADFKASYQNHGFLAHVEKLEAGFNAVQGMQACVV